MLGRCTGRFGTRCGRRPIAPIGAPGDDPWTETVLGLPAAFKTDHRACVSVEQEKRREPMAKPTGSSDASRGGASGAGGKPDPALGVRQAAENTVSQPRQARWAVLST